MYTPLHAWLLFYDRHEKQTKRYAQRQLPYIYAAITLYQRTGDSRTSDYKQQITRLATRDWMTARLAEHQPTLLTIEQRTFLSMKSTYVHLQPSAKRYMQDLAALKDRTRFFLITEAEQRFVAYLSTTDALERIWGRELAQEAQALQLLWCAKDPVLAALVNLMEEKNEPRQTGE